MSHSICVSIILPTYNMARFLPDALQSIVDNSFSRVEIIIIDDGSTDDTTLAVQQFKTRSELPVVYAKIAHKGKAGAINYILQKGDMLGDYIIFMDADDTLPPDSLQKRYDAILATGAEMAVGEFTLTNLADEELERRRLAPESTKAQLRDRFFYAARTPFHLNGTIIKRDLIRRTGPFDELMVRGQEVDYAIRLLKKTRSLHILPQVVYHYRKYARPKQRVVQKRCQFAYYRARILRKYLKGVRLTVALLLQLIFNGLKMVYELLVY